MSVAIMVPAQALPHRTPIELITVARRGLAEARAASTPGQRYATAHLAALRAAAAVLATRARPAPIRRRRITSVWVLLSMVAPELGEWSAFFSAGAGRRSAAEAGIGHVAAEEADHLLLQAERFTDLVQEMLELSIRPVLIG